MTTNASDAGTGAQTPKAKLLEAAIECVAERGVSDLSLRERCRDRAQQFAVTRGSPQVQRLLDITGVSEHLQTLTA